jgi:D-sedoheptulose 7-phosphate isomerase
VAHAIPDPVTTGPEPGDALAEQELDAHLRRLRDALPVQQAAVPTLARWGGFLAARLGAGARLLVGGNGGSAAEAQHLTAELVGRFDRERRPVSALALHADTSTVTAVGNDYGYGEVYARQVRAHARAGDVVLLLSTSGRSENLLAAARAAAERDAQVWALTRPGPNPLARLSDDAVCLAGDTATVQESPPSRSRHRPGVAPGGVAHGVPGLRAAARRRNRVGRTASTNGEPADRG